MLNHTKAEELMTAEPLSSLVGVSVGRVRVKRAKRAAIGDGVVWAPRS